jgi:ATP/maltotriose-dependent transcriptional regulator MalT
MTAASASRWVRDAVPIHLATLDLAVGDAATAHDRVAPALARPGLGRLAAVASERVVALDVEALVGLGRHADARRLLAPVERRARRRKIPAALAEVLRVRALVLAADGSFAEAVSAAEEAVRIQADLGAPLRTARAWFTLGEVLRRSRQKSASRRAFQAALDRFEQLGARIWTERSRTVLGRVAARRPEGAPLTESERHVAELAAAGRTNREIAAELYMSVHTVEAHLTRVFRTLGVQNRTELGRMVLDGAADPAEARGARRRSARQK